MITEEAIAMLQGERLRSHEIGYDNGVYTAVDIIKDTFSKWRFEDSLHLGAGDVRVTIGMVEELIKEIQEY